MTPTIPELLEEVSKIKSRNDRVLALRELKVYPALVQLIFLAYGPHESRLTRPDVKRLMEEPFKAPNVRQALPPSHLHAEYRKFKYFFTPQMKQQQVENMFVGYREVLHPDDFELLHKMVSKKQLIKGVSKSVVEDAFPRLFRSEK